MIDYTNLSEEEKIEVFDLRKVEHVIPRFTFSYQTKPGVIEYNTIEIGKRYRIQNEKVKGVNGKIVEVLNFIYKKNQDEYNDSPFGVQVKFIGNKKKGTYYNMLDLKNL